MKRLLGFNLVCAIGLLVLGMSVGNDLRGAEEKAAPSLATIKNLAGDWVAIDKDGKPTANIVSSIRVTAGGSAVREILFPGTDHEMVTMYHQEGPDLVLTHYCVLGNQPRMRAEAGKGPQNIVFKCVGGGNLNPEKDAHMSQGTIDLVDVDHIRTEWIKCENGKACETHTFELVRKK